MKPTKETITGLILAGGRGSRFDNRDKGLIPYKNSTLVEHCITKLKSQVNTIMVSANRNLDFYANLNVEVVEDSITDFSGPLAGIHAALQNMQTEWLLSIACDTPCFPHDYSNQLANAIQNNENLLAVAQSNKQIQSVSILVHKSLYSSLNQFLISGERKAKIWLAQHNPVIVDFNSPMHAFYNVNTPDDLAELERLDSNV